MRGEEGEILKTNVMCTTTSSWNLSFPHISSYWYLNLNKSLTYTIPGGVRGEKERIAHSGMICTKIFAGTGPG